MRLSEPELSSIPTSRHISFTAADSVRAICQPLLEQCPYIQGISLSRIHKNGMRVELSTRAAYIDFTFIKKRHVVKYFAPDLIKPLPYELLSHFVSSLSGSAQDDYGLQLHGQNEYFGLNDELFIRRWYEDYVDIFCFFMKGEPNYIATRLLSDQMILNQFTHDFVIKAKALLRSGENEPLVLPWRSENSRVNWLSDYPVRPTLSLREQEVATYALAGYTASDIGQHLHLSRRTIESHLNQIKAKLGKTKRTECIPALLKLGYIPRFIDK